jgi:hypothetical protein
MSEDLNLGKIITSEQPRDAIHIAVAPMTAAERLSPGQHVAVIGNEAWGSSGETVGVVDPYLKAAVKKGQRFWLFLYPGSIRSLRHEWTHPAFGAAPPVDTKSASEKWMRAWAMEHVSTDYYGDGGTRDEDSAYAFAIRAGFDMSVGPYESAREHIDNEWWGHWENITGSRGQRDGYFSCAC